MDDIELLQNYARGSEAAFTTLVERHIALVHSAAVRQVRDLHLAEEITQIVFVLLASKARSIRKETMLSGWLYHTTRFVARDVLKKQFRRHQRETDSMQIQMTSPDDDCEWNQVAPLLDEAMADLTAKDRDAVLYRFFENKTLAEVGKVLGATEEAARKRVDRAVEKLRRFFVRRGCAIPATTIALLLSTKAVEAAPLGLISSVSATSALSGAVLQHGTLIGATKTIAMTTLQKACLATAITAAAIGTSVYHANTTATLRKQMLAIEQRQQPLNEQLRLLREERDQATAKLEVAQHDNEQLRQNVGDLPKLRGEVARLRRENRESVQAKSVENDPLEIAAKSWATQVSQLKQRLEQMPNKRIPELQFVTDQDWFDAVGQTNRLETDDDFRAAMERLRRAAKNKFVPMLQSALRDYIAANDGQLP